MFEGSNRENNNKTSSCLYPAEIRLFNKPVFIKDKWSKHSTQELGKKKLQKSKSKEIKRKVVIKILESNEIKNKRRKKILSKPRMGSLKE